MNNDRMPSDTVFSTAYQFEFLMLIVAILVIAICFFLYYFIKNRAFRNLESFVYYGKAILICIGIILIVICLISKFLVLEITESAEFASIIFVLAVALLANIYISATFSNIAGKQNRFMKYILIITVIYLTITEFGDIGLRIYLNTDVYIPLVLVNKMFESNTPNGIRFMFDNLIITMVLFGTSFFMEGGRSKS